MQNDRRTMRFKSLGTQVDWLAEGGKKIVGPQ